MSTAVAPPAPPAEKLHTTADLLAIPDDGIGRWLIDGRIVEVGMTIRNKHHTRTESRVSHALETWRETRPQPRGSVHAGEAGVRLRSDPELTVGIDLVYLDPEPSARVLADEATTIIDAVPTLAVEILSPSDTVEDIHAKLAMYRDAVVAVVWILDPYLRTVTVHRPGQEPVLHNRHQELTGDPELPGFRVPVARLFGDD